MRISLGSLSLALFGLLSEILAQTYTACDPTNTTCPPTPGLNSDYYFVDFATVTSTPKDWTVPSWCRVTYNTKGRKYGAELEFLQRYDSQQLFSNFYFLFGRIEFVVQAAPGPGIISDMMTLSEDLDELDWEFRGSLQDEVQTGWFGKGVTGLYNHSFTPNIPTPMTQFHTYAFDWNADRVVWEADGKAIRTLKAADCQGVNNQYPQSPMNVMVGLWDAGDPDHYDPWSAGMTPIPPPNGGYSFYVKSVKIWNSHPAACYNWTDKSGKWQSIKPITDQSLCDGRSLSSSAAASDIRLSSSATVMSSSALASSLVSSSAISPSAMSSSPVSSSSTAPAMLQITQISSSASTDSSGPNTSGTTPSNGSNKPALSSNPSSTTTIGSSSALISSPSSLSTTLGSSSNIPTLSSSSSGTMLSSIFSSPTSSSVLSTSTSSTSSSSSSSSSKNASASGSNYSPSSTNTSGGSVILSTPGSPSAILPVPLPIPLPGGQSLTINSFPTISTSGTPFALSPLRPSLSSTGQSSSATFQMSMYSSGSSTSLRISSSTIKSSSGLSPAVLSQPSVHLTSVSTQKPSSTSKSTLGLSLSPAKISSDLFPHPMTSSKSSSTVPRPSTSTFSNRQVSTMAPVYTVPVDFGGHHTILVGTLSELLKKVLDLIDARNKAAHKRDASVTIPLGSDVSSHSKTPAAVSVEVLGTALGINGSASASSTSTNISYPVSSSNPASSGFGFATTSGAAAPSGYGGGPQDHGHGYHHTHLHSAQSEASSPGTRPFSTSQEAAAGGVAAGSEKSGKLAGWSHDHVPSEEAAGTGEGTQYRQLDSVAAHGDLGAFEGASSHPKRSVPDANPDAAPREAFSEGFPQVAETDDQSPDNAPTESSTQEADGDGSSLKSAPSGVYTQEVGAGDLLTESAPQTITDSSPIAGDEETGQSSYVSPSNTSSNRTSAGAGTGVGNLSATAPMQFYGGVWRVRSSGILSVICVLATLLLYLLV